FAVKLCEDLLNADSFELLTNAHPVSRCWCVQIHLPNLGAPRTHFRKQKLRRRLHSDGAVSPAKAGAMRENASAGPEDLINRSAGPPGDRRRRISWCSEYCALRPHGAPAGSRARPWAG